MNVALAAQTVSGGVSDALLFGEQIQLPGLEDSGGTARFLRRINDLFDVFNSRSLTEKGFKHPLNKSNWEPVKEFLEETLLILLSATDSSGKLITKTKRRMGILGFIFNINSLISFIPEVLEGSSPMSFFMTCRLSQDNLENFFSMVRARGQRNNNPSALDFGYAHRALLSHAKLAGFSFMNANCMEQNSTLETLPVTPSCSSNDNESINALQNQPALTEFSRGILFYVGGFVIRQVFPHITCDVCVSGIMTSKEDCPSGLLKLKNRGGLVVPSSDLVAVLEVAEKCIRGSNFDAQLKLPNWESGFVAQMVEIAPQNLLTRCTMHRNSLLLMILSEFVKVRRFHAIKMHNSRSTSTSIRQKMNKLVLFQNY
jgi:hypothetical protein